MLLPFAVVFFISALPSVAQTHALEAAHERADLIATSGLPTTFPFELIEDHVVVGVSLDEDAPRRFMFDTGAVTFVSSRLAEAHGGATLGRQALLAGGGERMRRPVRAYPSMTVGGTLTITDVVGVDGWDAASDLFSCITPNGLLGASAMRRAVWQVDYVSRAITVAASIDQLEHVDRAITLPFTHPAGLAATPRVRLGIGDGSVEAIVDTGAGIPITISSAALARVGVPVPEDAPTMTLLAGGAGGSFETEVAFTRLALALGGTELVAPVAVGEGMAPGAEANVGNLFLSNFIVTFDWTTDTLYLDPLAGDADLPPLEDLASASLGWQDGRVVVSSVLEGGPAAAAGLRIGEVVTRVDDVSVEDMTLRDLCARLDAAEPRTITTEKGRTYDARRVDDMFARGSPTLRSSPAWARER